MHSQVQVRLTAVQRLTSRCHGSIFELVNHVIYRFSKMPKFKRATAAHCALQAKKRKRKQREDPTKHRREQEHNIAAFVRTIQKERNRNSCIIQKLINEFARIQIGDRKNNLATRKPVKEFARTQEGDKKNKFATQKLIDTFVYRIRNRGMVNKNVTP